MLRRKIKYIIVFYSLYFSWLLIVIFFSPKDIVLNYFTLLITFIYFFTLREDYDFWWFAGGFLAAVAFAIFSFSGVRVKFEPRNAVYLPSWLPVAWGTTFVSLRKFYIILTGSI